MNANERAQKNKNREIERDLVIAHITTNARAGNAQNSAEDIATLYKAVVKAVDETFPPTDA